MVVNNTNINVKTNKQITKDFCKVCKNQRSSTKTTKIDLRKNTAVVTWAAGCCYCSGDGRKKTKNCKEKRPDTKLKFKMFEKLKSPDQVIPIVNWSQAGFKEFEPHNLQNLTTREIQQLSHTAIDDVTRIKLYHLNKRAETMLSECLQTVKFTNENNKQNQSIIDTGKNSWDAYKKNWCENLKIKLYKHVEMEQKRFGTKIALAGDCINARLDAIEKLWELINDDSVLIKLSLEIAGKVLYTLAKISDTEKVKQCQEC